MIADKISLSTGPSVFSSKIRNQTGTWKQIVEKLLTFTVTNEYYAEYMKLPNDKQARIKDVGYFIGGVFKSPTRDSSQLKYRSMITLDLDFIKHEDLIDIEFVYSDYEYVLHSTHKHSYKKPRLRLVFPLAKKVSKEKYPALARAVADMLDIEYFDETAFRVGQLMYWPSRSYDGDETAEHHVGEWIDPDVVLADTYDDWTDFGEWPTNSREARIHSSATTAEDPYNKTGILGSFCRLYDIHQAINHFELPYEPTAHDTRYRPVGSSGASGAVVYPSDQCQAAFLFSHHESDVVGSLNVNSWDLVRMHKFGHLDNESKDYEMPSQQPSFKAMTALALSINELASESAADEFSDVDVKIIVEKVAKEKITFDTLEDELNASEGLSREDRKLFMNKLATAKLSPADSEEMIVLLQKKTSLGKLALRKELNQIKKEITQGGDTLEDVENKILQILLGEFKSGEHIKRMGKQWWGYSDGLWAMKEDEFIQGLIQEKLFKFKEEDLADADALTYEHFTSTKISTLVTNMYSLFISHIASRETTSDPLLLTRRISIPVINCLNGEIYFDKSGEFEIVKHRPENFYTNQLSVAYDPDAECPEWDRFVGMLFSNSVDPDENIRHLEEVCGYTIQMSRWLKSWVLFRGPKDTGKTTVASVVERMLGSAVMSTEMSAFGTTKSQFAESNLIGKLLVLDDDFKKGAQLPDGFLKKISEEKMITADVKYASPVNFVSRAVPWMLSNYWPMTRDVTDAFRDRGMVFEFNHRFSELEKSNERRDRMLNQELPGILNRFIPAIIRLYKRQRWRPAMDNQLAHGRWTDHANPVSMFMAEMLKPKSNGVISRTTIWEAYKNWYKHSNPSGRASSKSEFYERMEFLIGRSVRRKGVDSYTGYEFDETAEGAEEFTNPVP